MQYLWFNWLFYVPGFFQSAKKIQNRSICFLIITESNLNIQILNDTLIVDKSQPVPLSVPVQFIDLLSFTVLCLISVGPFSSLQDGLIFHIVVYFITLFCLGHVPMLPVNKKFALVT